MTRGGVVAAALAVGGVLAAAALLAPLRRAVSKGRDSKGWYLGPGRIAVLPLTGEIGDSTGLVRLLARFGEKVPGVRAIVIQEDTPGGGVAASQEISEEILRLRRVDGIKVVASMGGMAASGGYYVASACDAIVADPGTVTGSIGVIMEDFDVHALLHRFGIRPEVVKSGRYKDAGSPFRAMTPDERRLFHGTIMDVYDQFVTDVATGRRGALARALARRDGRPSSSFSDAQIKAYVRSLADGRVYTGRQAVRNGLVDSLGGIEDAIAKAAALAGLPRYQVVTWRPPESLTQELTGVDPVEWAAKLREALLGSAPRIGYLLR